MAAAARVVMPVKAGEPRLCNQNTWKTPVGRTSRPNGREYQVLTRLGDSGVLKGQFIPAPPFVNTFAADGQGRQHSEASPWCSRSFRRRCILVPKPSCAWSRNVYETSPEIRVEKAVFLNQLLKDGLNPEACRISSNFRKWRRR